MTVTALQASADLGSASIHPYGGACPPCSPYMPELPDAKVTEILVRVKDGDIEAREQLLGVVYGELHRRAERAMRHQNPNHTLQPTALVNEAYVKILGKEDASFANKNHFLAVAAQAMGQIVIDHARAKNRAKNAAPLQRVTLDGLVDSYAESAVDLIALGDALDGLRESHPDLLPLVELRFFGGLTMQEVADVREVSLRRCERDWAFVRAWLKRKIDNGEEQE